MSSTKRATTHWHRVQSLLGPKWLLRLMRLYPPYLGAGIQVTHVEPRCRAVEVEMKLTGWNKNYLGTHFGGSLYSMCDPFYVLMLTMNLGPEYVIWDKSASIEFLKPGRGRVRARFEISDEALASIRSDVDAQGKAHPHFEAIVRDDVDVPIAKVTKVLSVRRPRGCS